MSASLGQTLLVIHIPKKKTTNTLLFVYFIICHYSFRYIDVTHYKIESLIMHVNNVIIDEILAILPANVPSPKVQKSL